MIDLRETRYSFRLHEFPMQAALRIQPESAYLKSQVDDYSVARMIDGNTPPEAKILSLVSVANAYLARDVRVSWQSAESDRLLESLRRALDSSEPHTQWTEAWPIESLQALRVRALEPNTSEWQIDEMRIYSGTDLVYPSPHWQLRAWPNRWEAPLAFDEDHDAPLAAGPRHNRQVPMRTLEESAGSNSHGASIRESSFAVCAGPMVAPPIKSTALQPAPSLH